MFASRHGSNWASTPPPCRAVPGVAARPPQRAPCSISTRETSKAWLNRHGGFINPLAPLRFRKNSLARHPILALVRADILLLSDFSAAVDTVARSRDKFMMISSRFNLAVEKPLAFGPGWDAVLRARARAENRMYPAGGSDLFVY